MSTEDDANHPSFDSEDSLGNASMDAIIGWLRNRRREHPDLPLAELIKGKSVPVEFLVDIACIDLMQQRRNDRVAKTEDYVNDFPQLADDAAQLDLIDAELCVDRELGVTPSIDQYADRFPDLRTQIAELFNLSPVGRANLVQLPDAPREQDERPSDAEIMLNTNNSSGDFSLAGELLNSSPSNAANEQVASNLANATYPMDVPEWFIGEQCVASGPGHWLIRGRDSQHGETLAMKVIALPLQVTSTEADQLLDACEKAAKVQNPSWVVPAVAAIQSRHLAVIRPWVYANPWQHVSRIPSPSTRLRNLATVAYAIQSAHQVGATHGAIQPSNLLIDHQGTVQVVDGCSSIACVQRWLNNGEAITTLAQRIMQDTQDLVRLVVTDAVEWPRDWGEKLVSQIRGIAEQGDHDPCGRIGDALLRWADKQPEGISSPGGRPLRTRIANWISRDDS